MGEMGESDSNILVIVDKMMIKVSETKEGLNIVDLPRLGPFTNNLDLIFSHCQAFSLQDVAKEFNRILVPYAFICFSKEAILVKLLKYLLDVFPVLNWIIRVDQNVIKVNDNAMTK